MKTIRILLLAFLALVVSGCGRRPLPDAEYVEASTGAVLTFSSFRGAGVVSAQEPQAKWSGKYRWVDDDTVRLDLGGAPMTMRFSPDRNELVRTDHLGNTSTFRRKTAEPPASGGVATRAEPEN